MKLRVLFCAGWFLGLAPVLLPAATVLYSTSAPTGPQQQSEGQAAGNSLQWRSTTPANSTSTRDLGFDFTANASFTLSTVTFDVSAISTGALGALASIEIVDMGNGLTAPPTQVLQTDSGLQLPSTMTAPGYLTFDITDIALTAGHNYGVLLKFNAPAEYEGINIQSAQNGQPGYAFYTYDGGATYTFTTPVLHYYLNATTVPEPRPTALATFGLGMGAVLWLTRRRRTVLLAPRR